MYFPDISPYPCEKEFEILSTLSVGWLAKDTPYPQCQTPEDFHNRLFEFCLNPLLRTRGFHTCEFCPSPSPFLTPGQRGNREVMMGSAQIRVIYQGRVYAAPDLIYHYVTEHQYCPPEEFIEAVMKGPLPGSPEYQEFLEIFKKIYGYE